MRIDEFDFELPAERIARHPLPHRTDSRLLVVDRAREHWSDHQFAELPALLRSGDLLIRNDARVVPARLHGTRPGGGTLEILLIERVGGGVGEEEWTCLARPGKRLRRGAKARLNGDVEVEWLDDGGEERVRHARLRATRPVIEVLEEHGEMPLPPYLGRRSEPADRETYQTTYARVPGAVAAPTAGLHFTPDLDAALEARGVELRALTLHVGIATFLPVRSERLEDHTLPAERVTIPESTAAAVSRAHAEGRRVIAVGTTTARALEGRTGPEGVLPGEGETTLFIQPGFPFRIVDALITNFHLPRSTLLVLVSAFAGRDLVRRVYDHAVRSGYRFFSYGDAMLLS